LYSFTRLVLKSDHVIAGAERQCTTCSTNEQKTIINTGSDYYLVKKGFRTHQRIDSNSDTGYRPYGGTQKFEKLCICPTCWAQFCRINSIALRVGQIEIGASKSFATQYTFRQYVSMSYRTYHCRCCSSVIDGDTNYWRIGHYQTYCMKCYRKFKILLGDKFSY
jgi:hypothetical protein